MQIRTIDRWGRPATVERKEGSKREVGSSIQRTWRPLVRPQIVADDRDEAFQGRKAQETDYEC